MNNLNKLKFINLKTLNKFGILLCRRKYLGCAMNSVSSLHRNGSLTATLTLFIIHVF